MQVEPYLDAPPLHLTYMPGRSDRLILAFSGVGSRYDAIQKPEAARLTGWDGENHVLFIADASRSWMNAPGLAETLLTAVQRLVAQIKPARIIAFGNSMGGSMALIFATMFKLDAVLALAPQFSVHFDIVPEERRWTYLRRAIAQWVFYEVPPLAGNSAQIMIVHGAGFGEVPHARRFRPADCVDHYMIERFDHSLADSLKKIGALRPLIEAVITGDFPAARSVLTSVGGITFPEFRSNFRAARKERRRNAAG